MKKTQTFEANDGTTFVTAVECKHHEEAVMIQDLLQGLPRSMIKDALNRTNLELADAFERAGSIIANKRRDNGELKRGKSGGKGFEAVEAEIKEVVGKTMASATK